MTMLPQRQAFIGVGAMGGLMAGCLLDAGVELTVHDLRPAAADPLRARGARWADTAAEAVAGCPIVWVSLPGPSEVQSVLLRYDSRVLDAMPAGATIVDTTTNDPETARRLAWSCQQKDLTALDAPVSGRPPAMTLMAGGERTVFDAVLPALEAVAAQVFYTGPAGTGCVAKLATQYMGYTNLIAAIEGMLIGKMGGVDPALLAQIVPVSAGNSRAFRAIPEAILDGSYRAGGTLDIVAKDVALACELAERLDAPANTGGVANLIYQAAKDADLGREGYPIVARVLEVMAGVKLSDSQ